MFAVGQTFDSPWGRWTIARIHLNGTVDLKQDNGYIIGCCLFTAPIASYFNPDPRQWGTALWRFRRQNA